MIASIAEIGVVRLRSTPSRCAQVDKTQSGISNATDNRGTWLYDSHVIMKNLGILLSGRGSNFEAIADNVASGRLDAKIAVVISNRPEAPGIESARRRGLTALVIPSKGKPREEHDREVVAALREHQVDLVCLAGYMRLLSAWFVQQFSNRILNIHPALLPAFPGLEAQKQALDYGVKVSGCTVHFVDADLDHGAIILQKTVPVLDGDDEHTLAARILEQEHIAYSEAIRIVLEGKYRIEGRRVIIAPITT
jgi:phosphoribosylglycinamide formyltransferase 1